MPMLEPPPSAQRERAVIIALGEKVFGALLAIVGAVIILTGHWATTDDMIGDLFAGPIMMAMGLMVLLMWRLQR
jgi:predicted phage tail protein